MTAPSLCPWPVVFSGTPSEELRARVATLAPRLVVPAEATEPVLDPRDEGFVWLPARVELDDALEAALRGASATSGATVATAPWEAHFADGVVPLGEQVLVAAPGTTRFTPAGPVVDRGVPSVSLGCTVRLVVPERVSAHLGAVNEESTAVARLAFGGGLEAEPRWATLAVAPLVALFRSFARARGSRRTAFTVAFLESFVASAAAAKLWELRYPDEEAGA